MCAYISKMRQYALTIQIYPLHDTADALYMFDKCADQRMSTLALAWVCCNRLSVLAGGVSLMELTYRGLRQLSQLHRDNLYHKYIHVYTPLCSIPAVP